MFHILVQRFEVAPTAFHVKKYSPNEVKEWFGGDARIRMLDQLFAELRHRGYTINIATRGVPESVYEALKVVGLSKHFDESKIMGGDLFDGPKVPKILQKTGLAPETLLLVDDDSQREEQAAKECKAFIFTNFVRDDRPGLKEADVKWLLGALPRI